MWSKNPIVKRCPHIRFPPNPSPDGRHRYTSPRRGSLQCGRIGLTWRCRHCHPKKLRMPSKKSATSPKCPSPSISLLTHTQLTTKPHRRCPKILKSLSQRARHPRSTPQLNFPDFAAQIEAILEAKPPVFSFTMGIPPLPILERLKRKNRHHGNCDNSR